MRLPFKAASICFGLALLVIVLAALPERHHGPGEAIQGLYSHLNCDTQPGTKPWYEVVTSTDADGNESTLIYFLGCRR